MSLLTDKQIRDLCVGKEEPMIYPFLEKSEKFVGKQKVPSFGISSYGYDIRFGKNYTFFKKVEEGQTIHFKKDGRMQQVYIPPLKYSEEIFIDPTNFNEDLVQRIEGAEQILIPPGTFFLSHTDEFFIMPRNITANAVGKSTWARTGLSIFVTPLEPGWRGYLTLEHKNENHLPILVTSGAGAGQLQFHVSNSEPTVSYADRGGKYQNQAKIPVLPR